MTTPHVNRIATATPPNDVHGAFIDFARDSLQDSRTRRVFERMAERSGVSHRFSTFVPAAERGPSLDTDGFYRRGAFPNTAARMARYERDATGLAVQAVERLAPGAITHLVVASCTGFMAPGLDQRIAETLGLGGSLKRSLVGFMGCYAAIPAYASQPTPCAPTLPPASSSWRLRCAPCTCRRPPTSRPSCPS